MTEMITDEKRITAAHNLTIEDRKKLTVSGVNDIDSYDEQTVVAQTELGEMCIHGTGLKIARMSTDMGELLVEGDIVSVVYSDTQKKQGGFFGRVFR